MSTSLGRWFHDSPHEPLLLTLCTGIALALLVAQAFGLAAAFAGMIAAFGVVIRRCAWEKPHLARLRLFLAYLCTLFLYMSVEWVTPALGATLWDDNLLAIDRWLLGETPALWFQDMMVPWLTDIMSACYLSYHPYLHTVLVVALFGPMAQARVLANFIFTNFAVGLTGYVLVPAVGPLRHLQFTKAPEGSWITLLNHEFISDSTSIYDVFPSLHVMITAALLTYDWRYHRVRFWCVLPVALLLGMSTLYLRYHYAVDVLAGLVFAGLLTVWDVRRQRRQELIRRSEQWWLTPRPRT